MATFMKKGTKSFDEQLNTSPHYSDRIYRVNQTEFCLEPENLVERYGVLVIDGLHYDYSDRLLEWDREKMLSAIEHADAVTGAKDWRAKKTARYIQEYLRFYYGKPIQLVHVIAGVNRSNGYPYLVYGTRDT